MPRLLPLAALLPLLAALALAGQPPVPKEQPPKKLTDEERKDLLDEWRRRDDALTDYLRAKNLDAAAETADAVLALARRLYPAADWPDGHPNLAISLTSRGAVHRAAGDLPTAEALYADALAMWKRLFTGDRIEIAQSLNNLGFVQKERGKFAAALRNYEASLAMTRRVVGDRDPAVALGLNNVASLYLAVGDLERAEMSYRDALAIHRRAKDGGDRQLAVCLSNLATLHRLRGDLIAAERAAEESLALRRAAAAVGQADPAVAAQLRNLAAIHTDQGKLTSAEKLAAESLDLTRQILGGRDHPLAAIALHNLAAIQAQRGNLAAAEESAARAVEMFRRLEKLGGAGQLATALSVAANIASRREDVATAEKRIREALDLDRKHLPGDHPGVALHLHNLGTLQLLRRDFVAAAKSLDEATAMSDRLFGTNDHPTAAVIARNRAGLDLVRGEWAAAEQRYRAAEAMYRRLVGRYAREKTEGEALTFAAANAEARDSALSVGHSRAGAERGFDPGSLYPLAFGAKGLIARVTERRHLRARAAAVDPTAAALLAELTLARRQRGELLTASPTADPETRKKRVDDLKALDDRAVAAANALRPLLPDLARIERLDKATPDDLRKALPADAVLVDYVRYLCLEYDPKKPGADGEKRTLRYVAFVVTRDKVTWIDLDEAAKVEPAVEAWRKAITGGNAVPPEVPATVRELVWQPVRKAIPAGVTTVYVCSDAALCRVPFAALPGDKADTILLDDFAVATVPHAAFLLDQLWPADEPAKEPPTAALVVGGVAFDAKPDARPAKDRSDPLVKDGAKLNWGFLPGTEAEAGGFKSAAEKGKTTVVSLTGEQATAAGVLAALPKARIAHLATHGYFADPAVRSALQPDPSEYRLTNSGERVGRVANSPLLMTGLVFAGANDPKAVGRGIVTGEALVDLDLSGLELAVLSACETGLGEVAGGEGVFGLQRAFHLAGTRNVVCSLWKVPDRATAALMGRFYHHLWADKQPPVQALRKAQLDVYRSKPDELAKWAKEFRGATADDGKPDPASDAKTAHPRLWAAFTLSGLGR